MKNGITQNILKTIWEKNGIKLANDNGDDFELLCMNGKCEVYRIEEDGSSRNITQEEIENEYLPFVFTCIKLFN